VHRKPWTLKKVGPFVPALLTLAVSQCWAQVAPDGARLPAEVSRNSQGIQLTEPQPVTAGAAPAPSNELPAAASSALPVEPGANAQVLQAWQQQTGQAVWVNGEGQLEFHGAMTVDVYRNSATIPSGNPALSPLSRGTFGRATFQGDVRSTTEEGDVTYLQGVLTQGNDRAVMPRYDTQLNSFQAGRAGPGYQIAVGDVVAGFSGLSSNLGLRGLLAARQTGSLTFTGFAGTVTETWESLLSIRPLDGFAARTRYSRDVYGGKAELQYDEELSGFVTLQGWRDRTGSAALPQGSTALGGTAASLGGKYLTQRGQLAMETAHSSQQDVSLGGNGLGPVAGVAGPAVAGSGNAFTADTSYRWDAVGVRAGYHDLSTGFASLAQTVAPGVREWYAGGDWLISPELTWSSDLRHALTRLAATAFFPSASNELDSLTNRLSYNVAALPGLMLSLSDTRNTGKDGFGNKTTNDQTLYNASYAIGEWNAQLGAGTGRSRSPAAPQSDSESRQWQLGLGRLFSDSETVEGVPRWTLSTQLFASGQNQQLLVAGTEVRNRAVGLNFSWQTQHYGILSAGLQRLSTTQPLAGMPTLVTRSLTLDWAYKLSRQWSLKTYARLNYRNHGDVLFQADERVVGMQGTYQW
jgi:hypothetical protein